MGEIDMNEKRCYRRGLRYRKGNVKKEDFIKEFKFKDIVFEPNFLVENTEKEKQKYYNCAYEGLKDLAATLNVSPSVLSLKDKEGNKPNLVFGKNSKGQKNLILNKNGTMIKNWFYFLDKYLGSLNGENSLLDNVMEKNDDISIAIKNILEILKVNYEEEKEEIEGYLSEERENFINALENLKIGVEDGIDIRYEITQYRKAVKKEINEERYREFIKALEDTYAVGYLNEVELENLDNAFNIYINKKKEFEESLEKKLVRHNTEYYSKAIELDKMYKIKKFATDKELLTRLFMYYINEKQEAIGEYDSFMLNKEDLSLVPLSVEEYSKVKENFESVLDYILAKIKDDVEVIDEEVETPEVVDNITKELNEDKGKFKLTYFKKLAQDIGLKIEKGRVLKTESDIYIINFIDSYVKYMQINVVNNPNETGHIADIYCGDKDEIKEQYKWDNELDYKDLINYIVKLNSKVEKEEIQKVNKVVQNTVKFKLTEFKNKCLENNLKVLTSETPVVEKHYVIQFKDAFIYILAPVYMNLNSKKEHRIKIRTILGLDEFYTWKGELDYDDLITYLLTIKNKVEDAKKEQIAEAERIKKQYEASKAEILEKEKEVEREYKKVQNERNKEYLNILDCKDLKTTKDLRDKLNKYVQFSGNKIKYNITPSVVSNIVINNVQVIDEKAYIIIVDTLAENELQGNSKAWGIKNGRITIQKRAEPRKQIEGIVESLIYLKFNNKEMGKVQKEILREAITFMICKTYNLDVRTYCNNQIFEKLVSSGTSNVSTFLKKSIKGYNGLIKYFEN